MTYELATCILKMILLYIVILSSVTIQTVKSQGDKDCDCKGFGLVKDLVLQVVMEQRMESAKLSRLEARLKTYETTWPILNDRLKGLEKNLNDINMKFNETVTGTKDKEMGFNRGIGTIVQKALISEKKERKKLVSSVNKIVNEYKDTIETFKEAINNTIDKRFQDISAEQVKYKDTVETFKVAINKTIDKRFQDITAKQADYKATIETYKEAIDNTIDNRFQDITAKQVDYKATIETYKEAINNTIDNRFQDIAAEQREYKNTLETFKVSINKTIDERFERISANQIKYRNEISLDLITINETRYMVDTLGKIVEGGQVRLVNGSNQYEGRLEVWHDWSWGTVCGDGFDTLSASVVCKMLNFQHTFPRVYGSAQFGAGASLIHLDNVDCKGTETSITQCRHNGWGINDCGHGEDVGISCTPAKCAKPKEVQHAVLRDKYASKEKYEEGDKVEYDCELGYTIEGITRERWCRNTKWTEVRFTCNPILCPTLPQIQHGSIFQDTSDGLANNYESVAEYTCDRDYYLNGNTQLKTVRRTCQSDGKWSGNEPICEVPKCNLIDDFYGGSVEYFGRRDLYSQAFYSCDENYSMIPSNVQHSTCENNLRWEPPPPKCFKLANRDIPNNGYLIGSKRGKVLHNESYRICCRRGFEVENDDIVPVNKESCSHIRNNNGTLKPKVECVEELCETDDRQTEYKHEDGSEFTSRIRSNEMVWMQCKKGYAFYDKRNQPLPSPQKRRCEQGKIQDTPTCIEAKSSLVGYPYRPFTLYRDSKGSILDRKKYIEPNEWIEVFCSDGYELYVEFNKVYLDDFFTTSRYGEFDKEKNKFPVCLEKRCYLNDLENAEAEYENKTHVDFSTKIQSGTYIILSCRRGFAAYDENGQAIETSQKSQCVKGTIVDAPKCQEAKCSLVKYPRNLDTSYYNLNLNAPVEDITGYIESSHIINVYCKKASQYELYVEASNQYITNFRTRCKQGSFKKGKHKFPVCVKRRCVFEPSKVPRACFVTDDGRNCKSYKFKINSESSMKIKCVKGYTLFVSGKEVKDQGKITCVKGSYPDFNCTANGCTAPEVNNTELLSETVFKHKEMVIYKCKEGYWFSKSKLEKQVLLTFESKCHLGNWTTHIPESCEPVACYLKVLAGNKYSIYGTENVIVNDSFQDNGTSIGVRCKDGFDLYDDADTLIKNTTFVPEVTCHVGKWSNIHWCKKRCNIPNRVNIQFNKDGENLTINDTIKHMESVNITCTDEPGIFSQFIKCENGIFDQYDGCPSENGFISHISTSTMSTGSTKNASNQEINGNAALDDNVREDQSDQHINKSKGCKLSTDRRYMYSNFVGLEKLPGDHIDFGETLKVKCRFIDMYTFMTYDYDYYNDTDTTADNITMYDDITNSDDITIVCKDDHTMTKITKECPDATKDKSCLQIDNGNVSISNSFYVVSCDKGFSLDIFEPEEKRSNCIDGKLKSVIGGQEPKCIPDRCKVPYDYDTLLSISDRFRVSLSGGSVVEVGDYVYFNCSKAGDDMHEPVNRRFKCINGQWIEDERDKLWKFGNNGTFPKCRKTRCETKCQNGGICSKDNFCTCKHLTYGKHCEKVVCDNKCFANGGKCVGPGICSCPEGKFGLNCEINGCKRPDAENMAILNTHKTHFSVGERIVDFTCDSEYFLSSNDGMVCQSNGAWSDLITCVKGIYYLISTKTGRRIGAGTNANVYITLFGHKGRTKKININGNYEYDNVDEIRIMDKDIRPITKVQIGHDGGHMLDLTTDWYLEYVSIYVENKEEFYVFRNNDWVKTGNDLTLNREGSQTCINTFSERHLLYPRMKINKVFFLGNGPGMSSRACKQACINWNKAVCNGIYRNKIYHSCYGFTETRKAYFTLENEPWNGELFFRTCK